MEADEGGFHPANQGFVHWQRGRCASQGGLDGAAQPGYWRAVRGLRGTWRRLDLASVSAGGWEQHRTSQVVDNERGRASVREEREHLFLFRCPFSRAVRDRPNYA